MKKIVRSLRLHLMFTCLFFLTTATAQFSDRIKYYIAYDGSGSVAHTDEFRKNLQHLFFRLVANGKDGQARTSFELIVFGESVDSASLDVYKQDTKAALINITKKVVYNSKVKHTHVVKALKAVLEKVKSNQGMAGGLFLFTDGILAPGDVGLTLGSDMTNYRTEVKLLLEEILLYKVPVFIIENSPDPGKSFFDLKSPDTTPGSYYNGGNYFWANMNSTIRDDSVGMAAFEKFVSDANQTIVYSGFGQRDNIVSAIRIQRLLNVMNAANKSISEIPYKADNLAYPIIFDLQRYLQPDRQRYSGSDLVTINSKIKVFSDEEYMADLKALEDTLSKICAREIEQQLASNKKVKMFKSKLIQHNNLLAIVENKSVTTTSMEQAKKYEGKNFEEALILGLSDYIVERAKMEGVFAFMEHMNEFLDKSGNDSILLRKVLFPNVYSVLQKPELYTDMTRIKVLFQRDLEQLPDNIVKHADVMVRSEALVGMVAFIHLNDEILKTGSLELAFGRLADKMKTITFKRLKDSKIKKSIVFTAGLIGYLNEHDLTIIDVKEQEELTRMIIALTLDASNIDSINIPKSVELIKDIYSRYQVLSHQIDNLSALLKVGAGNDVTGFRKYQQDLLQDIFSRTAALLMSGNDLLEVIRFKTESLSILDVNALTNATQKAIDAYMLLKAKDYVSAGILLAKEIGTFMEDSVGRPQLQTLIEVTAEVSSVKSAKEVQHILARHALPVASYRMKRMNKFSTMVTVYPGVGGYQYLSGGAKDVEFGIFSPVGVEFSWSIVKKKRSVSAMLTLLDVGNVLNYRLMSGKSDNRSDVVNFERILSPGVMGAFGFSKKLPLALTTGYMFNPQRIIVGITFDLPLFNIYSTK